ncbi:MAG: Grx4 family monothiol glutaredoxin [Deltaproteobacteria bacterium]|nr:Grx4 family monothiol glutaredoxin [Deltaproteobacteria bacterium]
MDAALKDRLDTMVNADPVVLFMKGNRTFPQCGFSSKVVGILDELLDDYVTVDVLSDGAIREGVKEFSDWPTIPQLYIKGEFVGGCDIITEMDQTGELQQSLGVTEKEVRVPSIEFTDAALAAIKEAGAEEEDKDLRLEISARFEYGLSFGPSMDRDIVIEFDGLNLLVDSKSARRADGMKIDFVETPEGAGFKIDNPNEPPKVQQLSVETLKKWLDDGEDLELLDVRNDDERDIAKLKKSVALSEAEQDRLLKLSKDTKMVFICHTGARSAQAAQHFLVNGGFTKVYNVEGGMEAWSQRVDSDVPRY